MAVNLLGVAREMTHARNEIVDRVRRRFWLKSPPKIVCKQAEHKKEREMGAD